MAGRSSHSTPEDRQCSSFSSSETSCTGVGRDQKCTTVRRKFRQCPGRELEEQNEDGSWKVVEGQESLLSHSFGHGFDSLQSDFDLFGRTAGLFGRFFGGDDPFGDLDAPEHHGGNSGRHHGGHREGRSDDGHFSSFPQRSSPHGGHSPPDGRRHGHADGFEEV